MILGPSNFLGKCCLLLLYRRIFAPSKSFQVKVYIVMAFAFLISLVILPMQSIFCTPAPGDTWAIPNPNCSKSHHYGVMRGIANIIVDLAIFILPIPAVLRLNLPLGRRIGILSIFMTGFM